VLADHAGLVGRLGEVFIKVLLDVQECLVTLRVNVDADNIDHDRGLACAGADRTGGGLWGIGNNQAFWICPI